ncbi:uncharacterized protein LOC107397835 [Tribolium castaneum]|uniref:uncharacterized protein LOC107397835 n=1 Tax=Tribolium castaneum TaxID=7070 RepID=UPI0030FF268B
MKFFTAITILLTCSLAQATIILKNEFAKLVEHDNSYIRINSFKFYKKSRTLAALNVTYTTLEDINSDEDIKITVAALQFKGTEYKKTVIDFAIGICTVYRANKFDSLNLIKDSNLKECPFPKGDYYINDLAPTADMLPPFFPEGKWMLDIAFTHKSRAVARVHWMLQIMKKI